MVSYLTMLGLVWSILAAQIVFSFVVAPLSRIRQNRYQSHVLGTASSDHDSSIPASLKESFQVQSTLIQASNESMKHPNKLLVEWGNEFGSYKRRFDLFGRGMWIRNANEGNNVIPFLLQHGWNETQAHYEATRLYVQSFERANDESGDFIVDTDFGRRVTRYSSSFTETVPSGAVLYGNVSSISRACEWRGNVHVTTTTNPKNGSMETTRRFLNFTSSPTSWNMIVEREYQPPNNSTTISCTEVFEPVYGRGDSLEQVLQQAQDTSVLVSPLTRVQGCVATVHVRTMILNDTVLLDGEADALVSRGLLALLSKTLAAPNVTPNDVLELDPNVVANALNLGNVLSAGRNDGLASMVRVVQDQIRSLLNPKTISLEAKDKSVSEHQLKQIQQQPTVAMLLSGGVDSSVALNMLTRQGYNVTAFYLRIWLEDELAHLGQCPWEDDYRVCQQVCEQAGVPLETISLQDEYKQQVISYTVQEAQKGRTPNPDIMCNSRVKFGCFYNAISERDFDHVASGHYAQLITDNETGIKRLLRAPDPIKDQSYFLCALTQEQLGRVLFPIGEFLKTDVRQLAEEFDLPNKNRPDSQGLCFLGKVKFDEFLAAYLGERPGDIVDARTGDKIGRHRGVWYHTVGQRKGIGKVLDPKATSRGPWYIVAKDPEHDIVYASNEYDQDVFTEARSEFCVEDIQWIVGSPPDQLLNVDGTFRQGRLQMKIRHGPRIVEGTLTLADSTSGNVKLDNKDGGLAPGQYVAFYDVDGGLECFGGGVISERHWARFLLNREGGVENLTDAFVT